MALIKDIKENWALILFIGGLIVGWTTFNTRLTTAEDKISDVQTTMKMIDTLNTNVYLLCVKNNVPCRDIK